MSDCCGLLIRYSNYGTYALLVHTCPRTDAQLLPVYDGLADVDMLPALQLSWI